MGIFTSSGKKAPKESGIVCQTVETAVSSSGFTPFACTPTALFADDNIPLMFSRYVAATAYSGETFESVVSMSCRKKQALMSLLAAKAVSWIWMCEILVLISSLTVPTIHPVINADR